MRRIEIVKEVIGKTKHSIKQNKKLCINNYTFEAIEKFKYN